MNSSGGFRSTSRGGTGQVPRLRLGPDAAARNIVSGPQQRIGGIPVASPNVGSSSGGSQIAGLYDLEETLGEGHYAVVKSARHVFTGERVAVKVIDKTKLDAATRVQMMQEIRLMKLVQHPHVVRLYEVIDTQTKLYLVLELADGGDMYDYIMRHEGVGLDESAAKKYFKQVVHAIQYCHELHVVHRDLKPENVVFFQKLGIVKLTDFGFSNKFDPGQQLQTSCGSLAYSAPEILLGDSYDAPAVDIWSLGVILYMLVCGAAPFQEANDSETLTMIMDCKYSFPSYISPSCKRLISLMLQRQPHLRASLDDIIKDPWLNEDSAADLGTSTATSTEMTTAGCVNEFKGPVLPLVSREHLTEEEHLTILQRMVNGSVAEREDIIDALDRNDYNHITATYFLLAERKLRAKRSKTAPSKLTKPDLLIKSQEGVKMPAVCETSKPTNISLSISTALVDPVASLATGTAASTAIGKVVATSQSPLSPSTPFPTANLSLLSPTVLLTPTNESPLNSNASTLAHLLSATTDIATSTAISANAVKKLAPSPSKLIQSSTPTKFYPGKHRKRRSRQCSIVQEEQCGIAEEDEEDLEEEEDEDYETTKGVPAVSLGRRGSGGTGVSGHIYSAGTILSTEPPLHSSTLPLAIILPPGGQTHMLSVRRRSSDRSSTSSRSSDGIVGAKVGSPVDQGTGSPKTPAPFPISSQIGSGSLSRQGSLNRGRTSDRSTATSHSTTPNSASERSSPSSPPGSNTSSNHSSPVARTRMALASSGVGGVSIGVITGRQHKLVATRSSPQLMHHGTQPVLKEIHEECEESGSLSASGSATGSPVTIPSATAVNTPRTTESVDLCRAGNEALSVVDTFPTTRAGVAVTKRLEQRRKLRMHQARAASCSSSEASEDEAGSGGKHQSKLSSALVDKGATTLARISERPQSSPGTSLRSGKKRHGVGSGQDRHNNDEEEGDLSPFQSACTQPRLRKGRENNQDDSSDNQDSGAPNSSGGVSSQICIISAAGDEPQRGGDKHVEGNTGGKSDETQNNNGSRACPGNAVTTRTCQRNVHLSDILPETPFELEAMESSYLHNTDHQEKNFNPPPNASKVIDKKVFPGTTKITTIERTESIDSTDESSEWDDYELSSILHNFPCMDHLEDQYQPSNDGSSPSSLEYTSKSPSPNGLSHSRANFNSTSNNLPLLRQRLARIQEGRNGAKNVGEKHRRATSGIFPDLKNIGEESGDNLTNSPRFEYFPRIQRPSTLPTTTAHTKPSLDYNSSYQPVGDKELHRTSGSMVTSKIPNMYLPSKHILPNLALPSAVNSKPLYRAHSCGSLFSLQHTATSSGHITVRHRRLSSQLCLPVESLPGVAVRSMSTSGRSAHVTATVFIDIYAPFSPASPTLIGSPVSPPSSGDDMPSFKGFSRYSVIESGGTPIMH